MWRTTGQYRRRRPRGESGEARGSGRRGRPPGEPRGGAVEADRRGHAPQGRPGRALLVRPAQAEGAHALRDGAFDAPAPVAEPMARLGLQPCPQPPCVRGAAGGRAAGWRRACSASARGMAGGSPSGIRHGCKAAPTPCRRARPRWCSCGPPGSARAGSPSPPRGRRRGRRPPSGPAVSGSAAVVRSAVRRHPELACRPIRRRDRRRAPEVGPVETPTRRAEASAWPSPSGSSGRPPRALRSASGGVSSGTGRGGLAVGGLVRR